MPDELKLPPDDENAGQTPEPIETPPTPDVDEGLHFATLLDDSRRFDDDDHDDHDHDDDDDDDDDDDHDFDDDYDEDDHDDNDFDEDDDDEDDDDHSYGSMRLDDSNSTPVYDPAELDAEAQSGYEASDEARSLKEEIDAIMRVSSVREPAVVAVSPPSELIPSRLKMPWRDLVVYTLLAFILMGGYWMRSTGRNWDDYTHLHPDERFLTGIAGRIDSNYQYPLEFTNQVKMTAEEQAKICNDRYPLPSEAELEAMDAAERDEAVRTAGKGGYFDAQCSSLNPNNQHEGLYVYGEYPLFTVRVLAETYEEATDTFADDFNETLAGVANRPYERQTYPGAWTNYNGVHIVGRAMNSVFDTLTILLVFLIGYRLFGRWQGLFAAGFYAFAAFPIQQSHFWTADAFTAFWVTLTVYFAVRIMDNASDYPDRVTLLPWVTVSLVIGIWQFTLTESAYGFAILLGSFTVAGFIATFAAEQKNILGALASLLVILIAVAVGFSLNHLQLLGVAMALVLGALLTLLWFGGVHRIAAFTGFWVWIAAAFGLWIFDSLAHYGNTPISTTPLIVYLVMFMGAGLVSSALRTLLARTHNNPIPAVLFAFALFVWVIMVSLIGEVSFDGMLAAMMICMFIGIANLANWSDYVGFGIAFGSAMAGRVNVLPIVGLLFLGVILYSLPVWDGRAYEKRLRVAWQGLIGMGFAGFATLVTFRLLQPHAFLGPKLISFKLNPGWKEDIAVARDLTSAKQDFPPAHQWADRVKWLFPGQNIVLYGLGIALGIVAVIALIWAIVRIARGREQWTRVAIPTAWIFVYFGWLGANWVATMRYFLPLYGMLTLLAAWGLFEAIRLARNSMHIKPTLSRRLVYGATVALLIFVSVYTALYGYGMTSIYRHELTRVRASRFFLENVPGDYGLWIEQPNGHNKLVNIGLRGGDRATQPQIFHFDDTESTTAQLTPFGKSQLQSLVINALGDPNGDTGRERIRFQVWSNDPTNGRLLLGTTDLDEDLSQAESPIGQSYTITFTDPVVMLDNDPNLQRSYTLEMTVLEGGPIMLSSQVNDPAITNTLSHMTVTFQEEGSGMLQFQDLNLPATQTTTETIYYSAGSRTEYTFTANADGYIEYIEIPHVADPFGDANPETMRVELIDLTNNIRVSGATTGDFNTADDGHLLYGPGVIIKLNERFNVTEDTRYTLAIVPDDLVGVTGTMTAWEGSWDDPIPQKVCPLPSDIAYEDRNPSGICGARTDSIDPYNGYYAGLELQMSYEDDVNKRDTILKILRETDYLSISSNRFYDSQSRIPTRWPMTLRYYEALFSGELGFELVDTFTSYAEVDLPFVDRNLVWKDQVLPTDDLPKWMNEFEAEEAFTVYDHPTVFVFRKTKAYSPEKAEAILNEITLRRFNEVVTNNEIYDDKPAGVITWSGADSSPSPNGLRFDAETAQTQREGGTWSKMFKRAAIWNDKQVVGVALWWLAMILMGWLTFPLMFWIFPGLPDKGYGFSKMVGWLIVAWTAWFASSLKLHLWNQGGLWLIIGILGLCNLILILNQREKLAAFIREKYRHLLIIEGVSFILFMYFIGVRLGNPDLWHTGFGGEKPMDFAYLNGVIRSTVFPAIDPWFSGGFINYYYWGFVLVSAPIKALGYVPSFAYNLVIPTLFSWTGIGAFSIAYNLAEWYNEIKRYPKLEAMGERRPPMASAYLAGTLAMVLAIFIGNLDTPRTFVDAVVRSGGWQGTESYIEKDYQARLQAYQNEKGTFPSPQEDRQIRKEAEESVDRDKLFEDWKASFKDGLEKIRKGQPFPMATHRWYWGPTRVIGELPNDAGHQAIAEMPYFTFLYGDLHAHMMAMPLTLLVVLFAVAQVLGAGLGLRSRKATFVALFLGGMTVGVLKAANTWDWITYLIVAIAGITYAAWVGQGRMTFEQPRPRFFKRLRAALDLRYVFTLWPLLLLIPLGMGMLVGLHVVHKMSYDSKLETNQVPTFCQEFDKLLDRAEAGDPDIDRRTLTAPRDCDGLLRPRMNAASVAKGGLLGLGAGVVLYMAGLILLGNRFNKDALLTWVGSVLTLLITSIIVIMPYESAYAVPYNKFKRWDLETTPLWVYLTVHGVFLFIIASFLIWQTLRWLRNHKVSDLRGLSVPILAVMGIIPVTLIATLIIGFDAFGLATEKLGFNYAVPAMIFGLPLLIWLVVEFLLPDQSHSERMVYVAATLALGLTLGVELFVLDGDNGRQNSVFKFYIQAWLLFSIAGGVALAWMISHVEKWFFLVRGVWLSALGILLSVSFLYPLMATQARFLDRMAPDDTPLTLYGDEYMYYAPHSDAGIDFNLRGDYKLIRWLQDNVEGSPYIVEASTGQYRWGGRVNINTGLPAVLGWNYHQRQQRSIGILQNMVWNRENNVEAIYETGDIEVARQLLAFYQVKYIIVGSMEHAFYKNVSVGVDGKYQTNVAPGFLKFDEMEEMGILKEVYREPMCLSRDIFEVSDCPPDRVIDSIIYEVIDVSEPFPTIFAAQPTNGTTE